jgi:hypothetical protein
MDQRVSPLERAFQLATSGKVKTVGKIKSLLSKEGYDQSQVYGAALLKQLNILIRQAQTD